MNREQHQHPITYRSEIVPNLYELIRSGESGAVVATASAGKSRLMQFMLRQDVGSHYFGEAWHNILPCWIDCNRMGAFTPWHLYELLLDGLLAALEETDGMDSLRQEFQPHHDDVIVRENGLLAQRTVERLCRRLRREHGLTVCLLLDEFDEAYRTLPASALAGLRALRDANKYRLCYLLFTREHPERLRDPATCEGLYEQFSRNVLYLQPYSTEDALRIVKQLVARRGMVEMDISTETRQEIVRLSGGHPGLIVALLSELQERWQREEADPFSEEGLFEWAKSKPKIIEECRKIFEGLQQSDQKSLQDIAAGIVPKRHRWQTLERRGLIKQEDRSLTFFSPLFAAYLQSRVFPVDKRILIIDEQSMSVSVNRKTIPEISGLLYDLLLEMSRTPDEVCERATLIEALYDEKPEEQSESDTRLDALVARLRKLIEKDDAASPQFLKTVRGRGFILSMEVDA